MAAGREDGSINIWSILSISNPTTPSSRIQGVKIKESHSGPVSAISVLERSTTSSQTSAKKSWAIVSCSLDGFVKIFRVGTGCSTVLSQKVDIGASITCMAISSADLFLGTSQGTFETWLLKLKGHIYTLQRNLEDVNLPLVIEATSPVSIEQFSSGVVCLALRPISPNQKHKTQTRVSGNSQISSKDAAPIRIRKSKTPAVADGALMDFFSPVVGGTAFRGSRRARNVLTPTNQPKKPSSLSNSITCTNNGKNQEKETIPEKKFEKNYEEKVDKQASNLISRFKLLLPKSSIS